MVMSRANLPRRGDPPEAKPLLPSNPLSRLLRYQRPRPGGQAWVRNSWEGKVRSIRPQSDHCSIVCTEPAWFRSLSFWRVPAVRDDLAQPTPRYSLLAYDRVRKGANTFEQIQQADLEIAPPARLLAVRLEIRRRTQGHVFGHTTRARPHTSARTITSAAARNGQHILIRSKVGGTKLNKTMR